MPKALPNTVCTPELNIKMSEGEPFELVRRLREKAAGVFGDATEIITLDGVRAEYHDGFGLIRPSNTTPVVVLRFEADNRTALDRIQQAFKAAIKDVWANLKLPF